MDVLKIWLPQGVTLQETQEFWNNLINPITGHKLIKPQFLKSQNNKLKKKS